MTTFFAPVDNYCERLDAGMWSEPVNAITNAAFFIAAWLLYRQYQTLKLCDKSCLTLIFLIGLVGLGSLTFHTHGTYAAMFLDIIPIIVFVCYFLITVLQRLLGMSKLKTFLALALFIFASSQMMNLPLEYSFNGSASYFVCLFTLIIIGSVLAYRRHPATNAFFHACLWFTASLTFRSIDMTVCEGFPLGTHFMWHICNGVVLYVLTKTMFLHSAHAAK
ncbi:MAG: ceramidase domain-containing protein [Alphaproteobacteria bacterium]